MEAGTRRLGSTLSFDPIREKDILEALDKLAESHKLGAFISNLLRLAFDSPEVIKNNQEVKKQMDLMNEIPLSPSRYNYFVKVAKEVEDMRKKIDKIYEMAYSDYILAQMGKRLGLEQKSDATLRANFILQRQMDEMCKSLGVNDLNSLFESNKLEDTHKRAEDVMDLIIKSYDSILSEIKDSIQVNISSTNATAPTNGTPRTKPLETKVNNTSTAKAENILPVPKVTTSEIKVADEPEDGEQARDIAVLDDKKQELLMKMLRGV